MSDTESEPETKGNTIVPDIKQKYQTDRAQAEVAALLEFIWSSDRVSGSIPAYNPEYVRGEPSEATLELNAKVFSSSSSTEVQRYDRSEFSSVEERDIFHEALEESDALDVEAIAYEEPFTYEGRPARVRIKFYAGELE